MVYLVNVINKYYSTTDLHSMLINITFRFLRIPLCFGLSIWSPDSPMWLDNYMIDSIIHLVSHYLNPVVTVFLIKLYSVCISHLCFEWSFQQSLIWTVQIYYDSHSNSSISIFSLSTFLTFLFLRILFISISMISRFMTEYSDPKCSSDYYIITIDYDWCSDHYPSSYYETRKTEYPSSYLYSESSVWTSDFDIIVVD